MYLKNILFLTLLSFLGSNSKPICTVNEENAGKKVYDLDEATCFIALKLNKKESDLKFIRHALVAEENYMNKIGLISKNPDSEDKVEEDTELDISLMVEYALNEEKVDLTREELLQIYDTEIEYLIFIGVVE